MKKETIYALGFFDGVHRGHGALLRSCLALARERGCQAGAATFDAHPDALVLGQAPGLICSPEDRRWLMEQQFHMDTVLSLPFDETMRAMAWEDFIQMLRQEHGAAGFVCGEDFRFGRGGAGTASLLEGFCREAGLPFAQVPQQSLHGIRVSSTHIRQLLEAGKMGEAVEFLGHPYLLSGQVVHGRQLGRTLGFPTANLWLSPGMLVPRFGVYACRAWVGSAWFPAVTNIGTRPTVQGHHLTVEPWLMGYTGDLYGQGLRLEFYEFLRPEQKFDSLEALSQEIRRNGWQTVEILRGKEISCTFPENTI